MGVDDKRACVCARVRVYIDRKSDCQVRCVYKFTQGSALFVCVLAYICVCLCRQVGTCVYVSM